MAQVIVNAGGIGALVQCLMNSFNYDEDVITSAATALGYIAGQSPHFALAIIECKVNWRGNCKTVKSFKEFYFILGSCGFNNAIGRK